MKTTNYERKGIKILVVEDVEEERRLLADFLINENYSLYLAADGATALKIAQKVQPDLILLDVFLPKYNGYTILQQMRTIPLLKNIPVIFVTGATTPKERVKGLALGAVDYITKPFDFKEVSLRLNIHLKGLKHKKSFANNLPAKNLSTYNDRLDNALFVAATSILHNDISKTPVLSELAKNLNTNTKRLNDAFKANCNVTIFAYLRDIRMQNAKKLLTDSLLEINEISSSLGFKNPANFSTAFRNHFNITPRDFRNSVKKED